MIQEGPEPNERKSPPWLSKEDAKEARDNPSI